jgi:two-component system sensor histidine kinase BaeS
MPSTFSMAESSLWPVASSPIAAQAYSRRARRLSPSLANRLRIGFAIAFALLTAVTVIGVGRLIVQRQDYENSIERSYQREIAARVQLAEGTRPTAARATIARETARRAQLRDSISGDTRDTVILVGAGLIAGLLGALLLFVGLIQAMRRPLEALVGAAGRLAGGDRSARVEVGGVSEVATLGKAFNEMAAELELEASERDRLDRMKDEFVLTASHELRSPLTSVQGFAELLMMERDSLTPRQVETVEIILDNCRHLVRLLNDLLDLARSDAGRLSIRPQPTHLGPLVEDVVRTMRAQTEASDQVLIERIDPDLPLVNVEVDRIRQILVNLVTNAHEYSPERASIQVTARVADNDVEISVTDNGPGIPPAQLEHIFERFVRGDAGLTQRVGGTGLGLAISKSLVELHGGTIAATSEVGRGSTFTISLPATGPEALEPAPVGTPAIGEGGRR